MIEVDATIVGGGIVGCAVAAEAARRFPSVVLLEKEPRLGAGVTSRNSEVAHGGMYYPTGSLKARTCVRGRVLLKEFCAEVWTHRSRRVVTAAGIYADTVAALAGCAPDAEGLRLRWSKGNYFAIAPRHAGRVRRLIYPVPPADGSSLGVHVCLDVAGQMRLGPDVEAMDGASAHREDYAVDPARGAAFFASARTFLPFLAESDLSPAMAGIRPRLARASQGFADFVIRREPAEREGLVNLVGIESPGLTAAPAIAEIVGAMLAEAAG